MRTAHRSSPMLSVILLSLACFPLASGQSVHDDPLVRMPGSQPEPENDVSLEGPDRCLNCHADYDPAVEPGRNWQGSMMAQASRDFLYWACYTVAGQDAMWAVGTPNALDLCLRCHFPSGWLEGRSDPPDTSEMHGSDYDGVHCDVCHAAYDPFYHATFEGTREGDDWLGYWDETNASATPSAPAAAETYDADASEAAKIRLFNGNSFFTDDEPVFPTYTENASGQFFLAEDGKKRGPFADAAARHSMLYSRHHKSRYACGACHDVSNPVLANLAFADVPPGDGVTVLPSEEFPAHSYFHVERTFSEFLLSDYGIGDGAPGLGPFDPTVFVTSHPDNNIASCQDCHLPDGVGAGCDKSGTPIRPDESVEHPNSGQPVHDLTGGNVFVPRVLASAIPGSPNYDAVNDALLHQGSALLTLDLDDGLGIDPEALLAGASRARDQLGRAAALEQVTYDPISGALAFRVQNHTGHKLISGFPEGRRMFLNLRVFEDGSLVQEINPYDAEAGTLKGLDYPYQVDPNGVLPLPDPLDPSFELHLDELVYEAHPSSHDITGEENTFHFVLATNRSKDNRIPPRGFRIDEAAERLCQPRWHNADAPDLYTADEYAGGFDQVNLTIAPNADRVEIRLYYQSTSREYIEFLRDEINGNPDNLTLPPEAYVIQTDPFFEHLRAWGDTIWNLWSHNVDEEGAAPVLMAEAIVDMVPPHVGVESLRTGRDGGSRGGGTGAFQDFETRVFHIGDEVVFRCRVVDAALGEPIADAVVHLEVRGPRDADLTTNPSDADGIAEARWQLAGPGGSGGLNQSQRFVAMVVDVTATGYDWDQVPTRTSFLVRPR